jgi:hypothetical protein
VSSELDAFVSLGAGVQSSTMLLMAAEGELEPLPRGAIFADTGWEPPAVYRHLDWLEAEVSGRIPVYRVSAGNLRDDLVTALTTRRRWVGVPLHIHGRRGTGMLRRQCTREYKLDPIRRQLRALGYGPKRPLSSWLGISWDELQRMRPSRVPWQVSRWPLVERRLTRADCLAWWTKRYPDHKLTKSACIGCPYHNTAGWREIRSDPELWADAIEIDELIRSADVQTLEADTDAFLHYSRRPLSDVDLSTPEERGQLSLLDGEGFGAECEGMCGV